MDPWKEDKRISDIEGKMKETTNGIKTLLNYVRHFINENEFTELKNELKEFEWKWKFTKEAEIEESMRPHGIHMDTEAIINLTEIHIPMDTLMVLSWGKKFSFPTDILNDIEIITEIDTMIENKMPTVLWQEAKKRSSIMIDRFKKKRNKNDKKSWLNFIAQRAEDFFLKHSQLITLQSDKGKHSVVMLKTEYEEKINELLNDVNTYTPINIDIEEIIQKNDLFVNDLIKLGTIKRENRGIMSDKGTTPAKFYGLPKIHKKGAPLRPITSANNSPGKKLSTLMVNILTPIFTNNDLHIRNSVTCKNRIQDIELNPEDRLVSFDVISMFTNIPTELAIEVIRKKKSIIETHSGIPFNTIEQILKFILNECAFFTYGNKIYRQRKGLPMGSPTSPLIANIIMSDLIEMQKPKLIREPKFIFVYVDDTISAIHKEYINHTLETLNAYDSRIKFTLETETMGRINFLDLTLIREGKHIATNWFKKPYASNRLLNYFSAHKHSTIINTAKAHIRTVLQLSNEEFFLSNRDHIINRLRLNNFPEIEILCIMQEYTLMKKPIKSIARQTTYGSIPYIQGLTNQIGAAINTLEPNITIAAKPIRRKGNIWSKIKDRTENGAKTNTIIKLTCNCRERIIIEDTKYKERARETVDRILTKYATMIGSGKCGQLHKFDATNISYRSGASSHKKTNTKRNYMAFGMTSRPINKIPLPDIKWRRHLKNRD